MSKREWRAAGLVAAVYVYFLIFAEFAFLELARPVTGDGGRLRGVMGALAAGGVAGGVLGARFFGRADWGRRLARWLTGCAAAAGLAVVAARGGTAGLAAAGLAVGVALGGATVCLAGGLRDAAGERRLGLTAGLGTGAAYASCNLPAVFEAGATAQTLLAAAAALGGALLARGAKADAEHGRDARATTAGNGRDAHATAAWTVVFLALVWMDSAAFYIIQHTEALRAATWQGAWTLWGNAAAHLGAALLAGRALDGGRAGVVASTAAGLLAAACHWITDTGGELLYVAGVSLYSTALVYAPARTGRAGAAAWIFSVAGWGGSALGIGMAQDLHGIPGWFAPMALAAVIAGLAWRRLRTGGAVAATVAGAALVGLAPGEARADDAAIARGREAYVAEGCIHCHSQYVRPGTADVPRWGPARPLEELLREKPPLFGNRRQGPDLLNVGNRRTPEWNRLHLISPRELSPGSRMPSYARLFARGERSGEDLVAYLASLGAGTEEARAEAVAEWKPAAEARARADAAEGAAWFGRLCAQCHGEGGRGDGPAAAKLAARPADLTRAGMDRDEERLARLIKFGRPGTAMAGHEALADETVVSLARYVAGLQSAGATR